MPQFNQLYENYSTSKGIFKEYEAKLRDFVSPILMAALGFTRLPGIERVNVHTNGVFIEYGFSCRGYYDTDDVTLPRAIFESDNPIQAATEYYNAAQTAKAQCERQKKLKEIEKLQQELQEGV